MSHSSFQRQVMVNVLAFWTAQRLSVDDLPPEEFLVGAADAMLRGKTICLFTATSRKTMVAFNFDLRSINPDIQ